jgi:hypothetical protein
MTVVVTALVKVRAEAREEALQAHGEEPLLVGQ